MHRNYSIKMTLHIKNYLYYVIHILIVIIAPLNSSSANENSILHFISSETPPFWSQSLYMDGMCGEIVHEISKEIGVKTIIDYQPTIRMIEKVGFNLLGNPDFFLSSHEFEAIIPIAVSRLALFFYHPHHTKKITYKQLDDLKGYTIGIMKGSLSHTDMSFFKEYGIKFEESYTKESLFKKLVLGRIDFCIEIEVSGLLIINRIFPEKATNFARLEIKKSLTPVTIMINSSQPNASLLGEKLKQGLEAIQNSGKYREILEKYYGKSNIPSDWFKLLERYRQRYDLSLTAH